MKENLKFKGILLDENDNEIPGTSFVGWHSRSMAVTCCIISKTRDGQYQFFLEKRGPGCPDNVGKYCMPCGYLGWGESLREGAVREAYEETGLKLNPKDLMFAGINDDPKENRENVTVRFVVEVPEKDLLEVIYNNDLNSLERGGEEKEVDELVLVPYFYVKEHEDDFAFNHNEVIKDVMDNLEKIKGGQFYKDSLC